MTAGWVIRVTTIALVVVAAGCDLMGEQVPRGRVIDQDTGEPIAGAIVVGRYMGGISWGGSSCNRAESAISDAQGWFELPVDDKAGSIHKEAYKRGYDRGNPSRIAVLTNPWTREWRISVQKWNASNTNATEIVGFEPERYWLESSAKSASGELVNVYLRRSKGSPEERIRELRGFQKSCAGSPRRSDGLLPLLEEILKEQVELGDVDGIKSTRDWVRLSPKRSAESKAAGP